MKSSFYAALFALLLSSAGFSAVESSLDLDTESFVSPMNFGLDLQYSHVFAPGNLGASQKGGKISFEYIPIKSIGQLALGLGLAITIGPAVANSPVGDLTLAYRATFSERQWVVPFVKGGVAADINAGPVYSPALVYGGGLEFCLSAVEPIESNKLDQSVGINAVYLVTEYARGESLRAAPRTVLFEGIHAGLRFEF